MPVEPQGLGHISFLGSTAIPERAVSPTTQNQAQVALTRPTGPGDPLPVSPDLGCPLSLQRASVSPRVCPYDACHGSCWSGWKTPATFSEGLSPALVPQRFRITWMFPPAGSRVRTSVLSGYIAGLGIKQLNTLIYFIITFFGRETKPLAQMIQEEKGTTRRVMVETDLPPHLLHCPCHPASLSLTSPTPHFSHPLHLPPLPCFSAQGPVVPPTAACGPPGCSEHHKQ